MIPVLHCLLWIFIWDWISFVFGPSGIVQKSPSYYLTVTFWRIEAICYIIFFYDLGTLQIPSILSSFIPTEHVLRFSANKKFRNNKPSQQMQYKIAKPDCNIWYSRFRFVTFELFLQIIMP